MQSVQGPNTVQNEYRAEKEENVEIRAVKAEDRAVLLRMMDDFYHSKAVLHALPRETMVRCFEACLHESAYLEGYLFEMDGKAAGFCFVAKGYSTEVGGCVVQIEDLYICPEFRGCGIGRQFIRYLETRYRHFARRLRLEVEPGNDRAIKLYRELGFCELPYLQMVKEW